MATANPLHVVLSSPSSILNVILPILGLLVGALLTYFLSGATLKGLRRNEQRFVGYVAIQRFLISTCEQAEFEVSEGEGIVLSPPRVRPELDVIGREAEATANLVASRQVLSALRDYTSTLNKFTRARAQLNGLVAPTGGTSTPAERTEHAQKLIALREERRNLLRELQQRLAAVNGVMRKDLDIEDIDWTAFDENQKSR